MKSLPLLLLFLTSCSFWKNPKTTSPQEMVSIFNPQWFLDNPQHTLLDSQGKPLTHIFYDVNPELNPKSKMVNIIVTTPEKSAHFYDLNLHSGQRFYSHSYCKQKDIWKEESGTLYRPPFSIGFIPRVLDQLGEPQKVILFGNARKLAKTLSFTYYRVKLVGAVVEQTCPEGNCVGKTNWLSRLVFLAVDKEELRYRNVKTPEDLKKMIDWPEVKASLENLDGHNRMGSKSLPHKRVGQMIPIEEAYPYFKKNSIYLSDKETKKIQTGCHILYDRFWQEVGQEPKGQKTAGFAQRLHAFTKKYYPDMNTCAKFVYRGNVNLDPEKFWFLSYIGIFYQLHKDGYFFDCKRRIWRENNLDVRGEAIYDIRRDIVSCNEDDIDQAMFYLPNFLTSLKKGTSNFYKFIEYDNHSFGTHNKLYSWVKMPARKFECSKDLNAAIIKETNVFPEDVKWIKRHK